jgi:ABC-type nickel/cobalt efflux system permease component RcnA
VFAILVLGVIAFTALSGAVHEIQSGNYADAIGPLLAVAFAAFVLWRQARGRRS